MRFKILFIFIVIFSLGISEENPGSVDDIKDVVSLEKLPDAILKDLDNKKVSMSKLIESKTTLISFWFLACEPCKKEMKYLDEFNKKYSESGFQVISINTDGSRALSSVEPFVDSKKYSFKVLSDPRSKYQRKLKGTSCPYTVMVNHEGNIVSRYVGYNPGDEVKLEKEIIKLIEASQPDSLNLNIRPKVRDPLIDSKNED